MGFPPALDTLVRSAISVVALPLGLIFFSTVALVLALVGSEQATIHRYAYVAYARMCIWFGSTDLEVRGAQHIRPGQAYIVVSNHESTWDPFAIVAALPDLVIRFVAKEQLMRIPIFGHALRLSGNVKVVRRETTGDVKRIQDTMDKRHPDVSLLFFAEGTRSREGKLRPFKMGAFATALAYGLPVLPIAVAGTVHIQTKGTVRVRRSGAEVEVGEPISVVGMKLEDRAILRDQAREAIVKLRTSARQRLCTRGYEPGGVD